ncbi:hypothetical protein CRUP_005425 [Coryphaenoides rupestris]|nr:hypothetical protein CRUP_005425 [Coryphaenoides rupestris]
MASENAHIQSSLSKIPAVAAAVAGVEEPGATPRLAAAAPGDCLRGGRGTAAGGLGCPRPPGHDRLYSVSPEAGMWDGVRRKHASVSFKRDSLAEPECRSMLIKEAGAAPRRERLGPLALRRKLCRVPPTDVFTDSMFAVGGWTRDDPACLVEQFCPEDNEWRPAAPMVHRRGNVAVGTLDGKVYAAGGEDGVRCYGNVERYDPHTAVWSVEIAPLSRPRSGVCLQALDGHLYAVGGWDGVTACSTVERYDPKTNTWSRQPSMRRRRSGAAAAVLQGHLYVVGGTDGDTVLSSVERYDPADGSWSLCPPMRTPRQGAACAVFRGQLYVAGGADELRLELSAVERFDPEALRWSPVKRMTAKRNNVSLVVFNGALLAAGGSDGITTLKTIEVYNPEDNTWRGQHLEVGFRGQHLEVGFRGQHLEVGFRGQHLEVGFRGQHLEVGFRGQHLEVGFRGPHLEVGFRGQHDGDDGDDQNSVQEAKHSSHRRHLGSTRSKHPGGRLVVLS